MFGHYRLRLKRPQPSGERACLRLQAGRGEGECILVQWRTEGGWGVSPHRNSEGPPKLRVKLNPIVKTVKEIAEFMMLTHQDVRKKGSKILKLPRFAIVLH